MARESTLGLRTPVFTVSLVSGEGERSASCRSYVFISSLQGAQVPREFSHSIGYHCATRIAYLDTGCQAEALSSRYPPRILVLYRSAYRYEYGCCRYSFLGRYSRFGVARRPGIRKELIAFGHPSGIRCPHVTSTTYRRVRIIDLLVKSFLRVAFGGLINIVGFRYGTVVL